MKPLLLLALIAAAPALAQAPDAALGQTADVFVRDLADLTRLATAAALVHERTGAFPATPFALLGAPEGGQTGARALPLSELTLTSAADSVVVRYVPLPVSPYVREDLVVTATVRPGTDGLYTVRHEMLRRSDPDDGGRALLYDRAGAYHVERGFGALCLDVARAREAVAAGRFVPDPTALGPAPLTVRVHPPGDPAPVFYERTGGDGR
ncbi:MAG TPA: hypothetical protein VF576_01470 [Rubricoccaceae bacterium]|jgi:hypothetical protein